MMSFFIISILLKPYDKTDPMIFDIALNDKDKVY